MYSENFDTLLIYYKAIFDKISEFKEITSFWIFHTLLKSAKSRFKKDLKVLKRFEKDKKKLLNKIYYENKKKKLVSYCFSEKQLNMKEKEILSSIKADLELKKKKLEEEKVKLKSKSKLKVKSTKKVKKT